MNSHVPHTHQQSNVYPSPCVIKSAARFYFIYMHNRLLLHTNTLIANKVIVCSFDFAVTFTPPAHMFIHMSLFTRAIQQVCVCMCTLRRTRTLTLSTSKRSWVYPTKLVSSISDDPNVYTRMAPMCGVVIFFFIRFRVLFAPSVCMLSVVYYFFSSHSLLLLLFLNAFGRVQPVWFTNPNESLVNLLLFESRIRRSLNKNYYFLSVLLLLFLLLLLLLLSFDHNSKIEI